MQSVGGAWSESAVTYATMPQLGAVVQTRRQAVLRLRMRLGDPRREMSERRLKLADLDDRLQVAIERRLVDQAQRLRQLSGRLQQRSPRQAMGEKLRALHLLSVRLERAGAGALAVDEQCAPHGVGAARRVC